MLLYGVKIAKDLWGQNDKGGPLMKIKNEALRMFLALTALILTAMLTQPAAEAPTTKPHPVKSSKVAKASEGKNAKIASFRVRR